MLHVKGRRDGIVHSVACHIFPSHCMCMGLVEGFLYFVTSIASLCTHLQVHVYIPALLSTKLCVCVYL